eukprot:CAMPEP_0170092808 /NCGR_PEP_ID=MMETSP0019_2-20121128/26063_1 /TAXON_ID=98059 /ORGANISM="Dinobryon sp., Strain UTEXLB2267" /LENGTH=45 /DNA_ID= /DNA_START= /DNA_END= /DNA_ORIENTATION=
MSTDRIKDFASADLWSSMLAAELSGSTCKMPLMRATESAMRVEPA